MNLVYRQFCRFWFASITLSALGSGCATVVNGPTQTVEVLSDPPGATATLERSRMSVTTPGSFELVRKRGRYEITFSKPGYRSVTVAVVRKQSYATAGNLVLGGSIGANVDENSGSNYRLEPDPVKVALVPVDTWDGLPGHALVEPVSAAPLRTPPSLSGTHWESCDRTTAHREAQAERVTRWIDDALSVDGSFAEVRTRVDDGDEDGAAVVWATRLLELCSRQGPSGRHETIAIFEFDVSCDGTRIRSGVKTISIERLADSYGSLSEDIDLTSQRAVVTTAVREFLPEVKSQMRAGLLP